jgi:SAM-dependent methyltransferase
MRVTTQMGVFHQPAERPSASMLTPLIQKTMLRVAYFYDQRKVGDSGTLGFRRSSDLTRLSASLVAMIEEHLILPGSSSFLDLGCADGRVNVLLSYIVRKSVGIEIDEWTLDEYLPLKGDLDSVLRQERLPLPPGNIHLYHGDSMDGSLHEKIRSETGVALEDFDLFYTYLTLQEEFAELIRRRAKEGALFMVYGLKEILPRFPGLRLLTREPLEGIVALYRKI